MDLIDCVHRKKVLCNAAANPSHRGYKYRHWIYGVGKKYELKYTASNLSGGYIRAEMGGLTPEFNFSDGTYTYNFTATTNANLYITASANVEVTNVSVKEITDDTDLPRIDYTDGCGSWLLEPQSTNLVTYSEDFSQWSVGTGGISIETGYLAPDGSNNATKVTMGSGFSNTALSLNASLGETDSRTIYARTVSGTGQAHLCSFNGNSNNLFDITEQWQRFEVNGTTTPTGSVTFYAVDFRGSSTLTEVVLWGAQAENQSFSTSYIPTSGATNTRLQDIASNSGNATLINSTEGVLYAEIAALADDGTSRQISISDGSYNNALLLRYLDLTNTLQGVFRVGGAFKGSCNFNLSNPIDSIKVAYKYKNSDFALWVNGAEVSTSTDSFSISTETLMELSFDRGDGTQNFYGKAKALAVFKEALTDAELQSLTTI